MSNLASAVNYQGLQGQAGAANQFTRSSILQDSGKIADRLLELHGRLASIADRLHGQAPAPMTDSGGKLQGAPIETNVARNLNTSANWLDRIDEQCARIDGGL